MIKGLQTLLLSKPKNKNVFNNEEEVRNKNIFGKPLANDDDDDGEEKRRFFDCTKKSIFVGIFTQREA
jgi:hypothetical protein